MSEKKGKKKKRRLFTSAKRKKKVAHFNRKPKQPMPHMARKRGKQRVPFNAAMVGVGKRVYEERRKKTQDLYQEGKESSRRKIAG